METDSVISMEEFTESVCTENERLRRQVANLEAKLRNSVAACENLLAVHEKDNAKIEQLESALTFAEMGKAEMSASLERIAHFVRVERILTGVMPPGETKDPQATDQNVAMTALANAGASA